MQQPGQPAVLIQPETGETRQALPRQHQGWTIPLDAKRWIQLSPNGQLLSANKDWTEWKNLVQLRLRRGDEWLGPPIPVGSALYLATARGHLQQVDLKPEWRSQALGTQLPRPLLAPVAHPLGVVEVSVSGLLALRSAQGSWIKPFPGWNQCFSGSGEILARPAVDEAGNIYLATRRQVSSWDFNGKLRWRHRLNCSSAVIWRQSGCYLADTSPSILRLEPSTGATLSKMSLPAGVASDPSIEKSLLAVVLNNGQVLVRSDLP